MLRTSRAGSAALLLVVGALASASAPATAGSGAEDRIPVEGTFSYHTYHTDTGSEIRGAVHAVRRVPGGTAVYYSLGVPAGLSWAPAGAMPSVTLQEDYRVGDAYEVGLIDPVGLQYYQPMIGAEGCLCPRLSELGGDSGELHVGWAVVPPLPPDVTTVSVLLAYGVQVEDVPVGEGVLEPVVQSPSTTLGDGWPALPDDDEVAAVPEPERFVRALVRNTAGVDGDVKTAERPGQVDETLAADVLFELDSATLSPAARATLGEVATRVRERAEGEVTVVGHTDSSGDTSYNEQLSQARAQAVLDALQPEVGAVPLVAEGRGESDPVADNDSDAGRAQNRRVTVTYTVSAPSAGPS